MIPVAWLLASALAAQTFDAATVKVSGHNPANGEGRARSRIEFTPTTLRMTNVTIRDCVQWAYHARSFQVTGPNSIDGERYDILARTFEPASEDQMRRMLQVLLGDRFKLALHRETKTVSVFELVVDKGGPKLPPAKPAPANPDVHSADSLPLVRDGNFIFQNATMSEFAGKLSLLRGVDAPVIDKTGIEGSYDIVLNGAAEAVRAGDGASIPEFVRQIGLKMISAKDPVETIVIDTVSRPSEN